MAKTQKKIERRPIQPTELSRETAPGAQIICSGKTRRCSEKRHYMMIIIMATHTITINNLINITTTYITVNITT